jgi:hypothetical protein
MWDWVPRQNKGENYTSVGYPYSLVEEWLTQKTNVGAKVKCASSSHGSETSFFSVHTLYSHKSWFKLCSCKIVNYRLVFQNFCVELIPRSNGCGLWYLKENVYFCLLVGTCSPLTSVSNQKGIISIIIHIITYYMCSTGEAKSDRKAGTSFIFLWSVVYCHFDLKTLCSNLTTDKISLARKKGILYKCFCFLKYTSCLNQIQIWMSAPERAISKI